VRTLFAAPFKLFACTAVAGLTVPPAHAQAQQISILGTPEQVSAPTGLDEVTFGISDGRPTVAAADGSPSLAVGGLLQLDVGGYFQHPNPDTQFPQLDNGVNLRRGRLYFVGKSGDFTLNLTPDFGGSPAGAPSLYEANLDYTGITRLTATLGYFHPVVSLEDATSASDLLFLERPSIVNIGRSVAAGTGRASLGAAASTRDWFASAYLTGPVLGSEKITLLNGEQLALVGRLAARPYHDNGWAVHAGLSGQTVFRTNTNTNVGNAPGASQTTLVFADYPELRIAFDKLVDTGPLSASGAGVYGGEFGASWRNFLIESEFCEIGVTQAELPGVAAPKLGFRGGYVEGSWVITGEPHRYDSKRAAWNRPKPDRPFALASGGFGAWEVAARYSTVDLNSGVVSGVSQSVTGGVYGGRQQIAALALNWYPNDWLRVMLQFQYVDVDKLDLSGTEQIGQRFETIAARLQASW
jgi:phosphate-selective porin OprO and OprP